MSFKLGKDYPTLRFKMRKVGSASWDTKFAWATQYEKDIDENNIRNIAIPDPQHNEWKDYELDLSRYQTWNSEKIVKYGFVYEKNEVEFEYVGLGKRVPYKDKLIHEWVFDNERKLNSKTFNCTFEPPVEGIIFEGTNYVDDSTDPTQWNGWTDVDANVRMVELPNPTGQTQVLEFVYNNTLNNVWAPIVSNYVGSVAGSYYTCIVFKHINGVNHGFQSRLRNATETVEEILYNISTNNSSHPDNIKVTDLRNGFKLLQMRHDYDGTQGDVRVELYWRQLDENATTRIAPENGSSAYLQSAYFGPNDKWPALYVDGGTKRTKDVVYNLHNQFLNYQSPESWYGNVSEGTDTISHVVMDNPTKENYVGLATQVGTDQMILAQSSGSSEVPVKVGDVIYAAIIVKPVDSNVTNCHMRFRFSDTEGFRGDAYFDVDYCVRMDGSAITHKLTTLENGFCLYETRYVVTRDSSAFLSQIFLWDRDNVEDIYNAAPGTQIYVQGAFMGKYDKELAEENPNYWPSEVVKEKPHNFMRMTPTSADYRISTNRAGFVGSRKQYVEAKVRFNRYDNLPAVKMFYTINDDAVDGFTPTQNLAEKPNDNINEWQIIRWNCNEQGMEGAWHDSTVKQLRFDPLDSTHGVTDIEYIKVFEKDDALNVYDNVDEIVYLNENSLKQPIHIQPQSNISYLFDGIDAELALEAGKKLYNNVFYYAANRVRDFNEANPVWPPRQDLVRLSFSGVDNGATRIRCNVTHGAKVATFNSTSNDPYIVWHSSHGDFTAFTGHRDQQIVIKYRVPVKNDTWHTSLYFGSAENGLENEDRKINLIHPDNIPTTLSEERVYDLEDFVNVETEWHGKTINLLRLDWAQSHPTTCEIDYIIVRSKRTND